MNHPNANEPAAGTAITARSGAPKSAKQRKAANPAKQARARKSGKPSTRGKAKSKKEQLIELLSKLGGARISTLVERLGWQSHTVRAALSRLRKQGHEIATSKSAKGNEAVYAIVRASPTSKVKSGKAASARASS
jgi:hypothetical protein